MRLLDEGSTNSLLLREVSNWQDHSAWVSFRDRYEPLLRRWCRGYGLDSDSTDEVCQRIWIELADRMKTLHYDPNRTFRGRLRRLCDSRVIDFLRQRQAVCALRLDDRDCEPGTSELETAVVSAESNEGDLEADVFRLFLLDEAEKVQSVVKAKVKPSTWGAFWLLAVCDRTVEQTAKDLGMTHTAVYAARERVARMLCDEGKRVSDRWGA